MAEGLKRWNVFQLHVTLLRLRESQSTFHRFLLPLATATPKSQVTVSSIAKEPPLQPSFPGMLKKAEMCC